MDSFCGGYWGLTGEKESESIDRTWDGGVDFGTCFENLVIATIPAAYMLIVGVFRMVHLHRTRSFLWAYPSGLFLLKQALATITAALMLADLLRNSWIRADDVFIVSPAAMLLGSILVVLLLHVEHSRGSRSSGVATMFWLLTLIADAIRLRTAILRDEHHSDDNVAFIVLICHLSLALLSFAASLFLEPAGSYSVISGRDKPPCPEVQAPLFSWLTFWWTGTLMKLGYKKSLTQDDLWDIAPEDVTERLTRLFFREWDKEKNKAEPSLVSALHRAFGTTFYIAGLFKLGQDLLNFVGPLLLSSMINFVADPSVPAWHGYAYAGLLLGAAELQSLILHQYFHRVMSLGMRLRSAVMAAVYNKALLLSTSSKQATTTGEMVNLMAVDAQRFMDLMSYLHMLWSGPLQIAVALFLLWEQMNYAVFGGVGVMVLMIPLNGYIAKKSRSQQVAQMAQKDQRMKLMNEVLMGIKVIKLYAWELPYSRFIDTVREKELKVLKANSYINAIAMFSWSCAPFFVSLVTFVIYSLAIGNLTASKAFVSLSLFNILRFPMTMLPMLVSSLAEAQVSINRLKTFLLRAELRPDDVTRIPAASAQPGQAVISVQRASFSWSTSSPPVLRDLEFSVLSGQLMAVVGQVGAGKSSLVSALLGDMEKISGRVTIPSSVAYVPQQAWIQNATLRDNVLFGKPFDAHRYAQVISACALEQDLTILPAGDMTEIGEKGINLSGGQKQRVSLARAVYQDADCYFLDDPLSAVDAHVGKHIFEHVIGPRGVLQRKTRVLVTHGVNFLPMTDQVLVLREGRVTERGPYLDLLANNGDFAHFIAEHAQEEGKAEEGEGEGGKEEGAKKKKSEEAGAVPTTTIPGTTVTTASTSSLTAVAKGTDSEKGAGEKSKIIIKETVGEGDVKRQVYISYLRANGFGMSIIILFLYLVSFGCQIGSSIWLSIWSSDSNPSKSKIDMYLGVYAALGMANSLGTLIVTLVSAVAAIHASRLLHAKMLTAVMRSPMIFFDTTPLGRIVNRFSKDMYAVDETIPRSFRSFLSTGLQVLSIIVVISYSTPIFLAAVVPMGLLYYWIQRYYVATSRQLQRLESVSRSPIYALFSETLSGVASIRAYGRQRSFIALNETKIDTNQQAYYPSICANRWLALRLEFLGNMIIFFAALFAVIEREYGSIDPGVVGLSLSYAMSVTQTLNWMVRMSSQLESDIVAVERVEEYIALPPEAPLQTDHIPNRGWPAQGQIAFENLGLRYRPGLDLALRNLSVIVRGGEKVGIVGRTGAGKSTLTLSLFRLIEPATGRVVIDGEDISLLGLQDLRSNLTVMPQDPVLFCGTVRDNLDPFHTFRDEDIWNALRTCHLNDHITRLGQGLEGRVAEGGENFSVGQRQLLCLARALLRKTKVLVLDEATAAVDLETDQLIQRTIRTEFAACTVLTIAHRINTILDNDRVLVLDKGEVVEFDTPANLLARPDSIFRGMCTAAGIQ